MPRYIDDLISRRAAINALGDIHLLDYNAQTYKARIEKLPSKHPKQKKGKWEYVDDVGYRCSVCHKYAYGCLGEVLSGQYKYCPYCGVEMEKTDETN